MSVAQLDAKAYYTLGTELSKMWIKADEKVPPALMPVLALVEVSGADWMVLTAFVNYQSGDLKWRFPLTPALPGTATVHYWMPEPWRPGGAQ